MGRSQAPERLGGKPKAKMKLVHTQVSLARGAAASRQGPGSDTGAAVTSTTVRLIPGEHLRDPSDKIGGHHRPLISIDTATNGEDNSNNSHALIATGGASNDLQAQLPNPQHAHLVDPAAGGGSGTRRSSSLISLEGNSETTVEGSVDEVRANFIHLARYNKLQGFYIGTLIYSVINIGFLSYVTLFADNWPPLTADNWAPRPPSGQQWTGHPSGHAHHQGHYPNEQLANVTCPPSARPVWLQRWPLEARVARWLLLTLPPLSLMLGLVVAVMGLNFTNTASADNSNNNNNHHHHYQWLRGQQQQQRRYTNDATDQAAERAKSRRHRWLLLAADRGCQPGQALERALHWSGLVLVHLLLYVPLILPSYLATAPPSDPWCALSEVAARAARAASTWPTWPARLPLGALLALAYLEPMLFEGSPIGAKLIGAILLLPLFVLAPIGRILWWLASESGGGGMSAIKNNAGGPALNRRDTPDDNDHDRQRQVLGELALLLSCGLPLALLLGHLKRRQFWATITRRTFSGANQLIEAKVSLEHQRQQQETLLLSVLPAYVAEQVKRNMLKQTTTALLHASSVSQQPAASSPAISALVTGTTGAAESIGAAEPVASSILTNEPGCASFTQVPRRASSPKQVQVTCTGTSATASVCVNPAPPQSGNGANSHNQAAIVHTNQRQPIGSSLSHTRTASHSNLSQQAPCAPVLPPGGAASIGPQLQQQQHARRGFNELYIRTYNNVSLLYGDIVGFTRLCTQLSSSQLVRVLNDLFSHFDFLAEKHKIMRIKILGDCYYGVSGIPEFAVMGAKSRASSNDNHAINCVNMGLDMIHYIRCLNIERATSSNIIGATSLSASSQSMNITQSVSANMSTKDFSGKRASMITNNNNNNIIINSNSDALAFSWHNTPISPDNHTLRPYSASPSSLNLGSQLWSSQFQQQQQENAKTQSSSSPSRAQPPSISGQCSPLPAFELNMRIGIHTGHIHSGVIGLKKWQFDVWSNDVSIAMHSESSGIPGRVQVTEATLQHLNGAFTYEDAPGAKLDPFLSANDIRTYLIREPTRPSGASSCTPTSSFRHHGLTPPASGGEKLSPTNKTAPSRAQAKFSPMTPSSAAPSPQVGDEDKIRAATIGTIRQTLLAGQGANSSGGLLASCCGPPLAMLGHHDMHTLSLDYRDSAMNKLYLSERWSLGANCGHLWGELACLLLLFLVLLPLISSGLIFNAYSHDNQPAQVSKRPIFMALMVAGGSLATVLLMIGLLVATHKNVTSQVSSKGKARLHQPSDWTTQACGGNFWARDQDQQGGKAALFESARALGQLLDRASKPLASLGHHGRPRGWRRWARWRMSSSSFRLRGRPLSCYTATLLLIAVILVQVYLIFSNRLNELRNVNCSSISLNKQFKQQQTNHIEQNVRANPSDVAPNSESSMVETLLATNGQYQLTVILLIVSVDSSVNLLTYKSKCFVIIAIICLQLLNAGSRPLVLLWQHWFSQNEASNCGPRNAFGHSSGKTDEFLTNQQLDYTNKANFLWRNRLNVDHEELEYISGINKLLLENILPSHVVQYYLTHPKCGRTKASDQLPELRAYMRMSFSNMRNLSNELYHEQHESVAVMFASIPHFYEFYDESDISKQGLGCIALLNEIICDFDKLLLKNKFSRIEKIKTIGSTYMAAAGLRPCPLSGSRSSTVSQQQHQQQLGASIGQSQAIQTSVSLNSAGTGVPHTGGRPAWAHVTVDSASNFDDRKLVMSQQKLNLICMVQFATSLMTALNGINKQSFQVFKLRVGVNTGSVIAGVIGAQRPFYDIWGDCVNIASRMESLGEVGRIQVEERTAKLLMESLCADTYSIVRRGPIDVKGKGGMVTYFVDKKKVPASNNGERSAKQQPQVHSQQEQAQSTCETTNAADLSQSGELVRPKPESTQQAAGSSKRATIARLAGKVTVVASGECDTNELLAERTGTTSGAEEEDDDDDEEEAGKQVAPVATSSGGDEANGLQSNNSFGCTS